MPHSDLALSPCGASMYHIVSSCPLPLRRSVSKLPRGYWCFQILHCVLPQVCACLSALFIIFVMWCTYAGDWFDHVALSLSLLLRRRVCAGKWCCVRCLRSRSLGAVVGRAGPVGSRRDS